MTEEQWELLVGLDLSPEELNIPCECTNWHCCIAHVDMADLHQVSAIDLTDAIAAYQATLN